MHTFGAYFGLAVSMALDNPTKKSKQEREKANELNTSRYDSDITAMLGTIVLWILWPSFNGALAPTPAAQMRVVLNTVLALASSCVWAFLISYLAEKNKFDMVHIQNATLAGGIAIGSSSDLVVGPGGAIIIGAIGGIVSVLGYIYVSPWLAEKIGLQDTCGVHNLHGMPGLVGACAGTISCAVASEKIYGTDFTDMFNGRTPSEQWPHQLYALLVTLGIALVGGLLTGLVMKLVDPSPTKEYDDSQYWTGEGEPLIERDPEALSLLLTETIGAAMPANKPADTVPTEQALVEAAPPAAAAM